MTDISTRRSCTAPFSFVEPITVAGKTCTGNAPDRALSGTTISNAKACRLGASAQPQHIASSCCLRGSATATGLLQLLPQFAQFETGYCPVLQNPIALPPQSELSQSLQVASTTNSESFASVEASCLPKQSVDNVKTPGSTDLLQQEAALSSPPQASPLADRPHLASLHNGTEIPGTPGSQSDHNSEQLSEPGQAAPLEEGELPDAQPDDPDSVFGSQQHALEGAAAVPAAASTAKRKRGERAGKRVRQRQARRLRNMELAMLPTNGARLAPPAPKKLVGTKKLPTCKYELLPFRLLYPCIAAFSMKLLPCI